MISKWILFIGILVSIIIRSYFILNGSEVADIHALHEMGQMIEQGMNPYIALNYNSYPPLAIYLEFITSRLAQNLNIPFYILIKIWPNLADFLIALILGLFLFKQGVKLKTTYIWVLVFLLNPVSIIISAAHGQIDSIPTLLVVLSIFILTFNSSRLHSFLVALLLGFSIAIKPNPLVLIPFFILYNKSGFKTKIIFLFVSLVPVFLLFIPFIKHDSQFVISKMLDYSGSKDFGFAAILRGIYFNKTLSYNLNFSDQSLGLSKVLFLISLIIIAFIYKKSSKLTTSSLLAYLCFLTFYLGISAQYLSWILPFAILRMDKMIIPYTVFCLISLIGFYFFINPTILLSQLSSVAPYQNQYMSIYFFGNLFLWITTLIWIIRIIYRNFASPGIIKEL